MDALVDGLLEELNCDVVFKIPIFGGIHIYESVVVTWIIMAVVFLLCFFLTRRKRKGLHTISGNSNHLYRNSKPDRLAWLQTADKGYERHRSTRCNEHSSYRGGRNQGKGHQKVA